jgi:hypothetical protein
MNMPHPEKQVRRKSRWRKQNATRALMFARMRAAKEAKRVAALTAEPVMPDAARVPAPKKRSGFRVTVTCLDDGARVSFTASRLPWGLSVSPTLAGRKVAAVLGNYQPGGHDA